MEKVKFEFPNPETGEMDKFKIEVEPSSATFMDDFGKEEKVVEEEKPKKKKKSVRNCWSKNQNHTHCTHMVVSDEECVERVIMDKFTTKT